MKKILLFGLALLLPVWLQAQESEFPRAEFFGGYQFLHLGGEGSSVNANGWNVSVTGNMNHWFGVTGDFSGSYKTVNGVSANVYSYTFGPTLSLNHAGRVNPFVHGLFGGAHLGASMAGLGSGSTNGFTMLYGGGVDAKVSKMFAVRVFQADWVYYRFSGISQSSNVRVSTGVVLRF